MPEECNKRVFIDGSRVLIEGTARAGVEVYVGYPITPANWLYSYAQQRIPISLAAPDEITALQWAAGFSATGKFPLTATSFPGFALMLETLNMAFMMELPMVIILAQRLGPSTGSATTGAQGDLLLVRGCLSGGYSLPVLCPSTITDCWDLAARSVATAINLRTPVILLTSKEMIMTDHSVDLSTLTTITPTAWRSYDTVGEYLPYKANDDLVPPFLPVGNSRHQVRLNASTHDTRGLIQKVAPDAMSNTVRLRDKVEQRVLEYTYYDYDADEGATTLLLTYDISAEAARDAITILRTRGKHVSLLVMKTLLPVPPPVLRIVEQYEQVVIIEENLSGLLRELLFGHTGDDRVRSVNKIGGMVTPSEIVQGVEQCQRAS